LALNRRLIPPPGFDLWERCVDMTKSGLQLLEVEEGEGGCDD
jgi:hypothetical protein